MMTNVMAGSYPDLIAATSIYSGVPFGCFAGASDWNSQCAQGQLIKSAEDWVRCLCPELLLEIDSSVKG